MIAEFDRINQSNTLTQGSEFSLFALAPLQILQSKLQSKLQHYFNRDINEDSVVPGVALVLLLSKYNLMHTHFHSASWHDGIPFDYRFTLPGLKPEPCIFFTHGNNGHFYTVFMLQTNYRLDEVCQHIIIFYVGHSQMVINVTMLSGKFIQLQKC